MDARNLLFSDFVGDNNLMETNEFSKEDLILLAMVCLLYLYDIILIYNYKKQKLNYTFLWGQKEDIVETQLTQHKDNENKDEDKDKNKNKNKNQIEMEEEDVSFSHELKEP